jgi:hypothetical protein
MVNEESKIEGDRNLTSRGGACNSAEWCLLLGGDRFANVAVKAIASGGIDLIIFILSTIKLHREKKLIYSKSPLSKGGFRGISMH